MVDPNIACQCQMCYVLFAFCFASIKHKRKPETEEVTIQQAVTLTLNSAPLDGKC